MTSLIANQKEFSDMVCSELKEIKNSVLECRNDISAILKK